LPDSFLQPHDTSFVTGLDFILSKDPLLYNVIAHNRFDLFFKENLEFHNKPDNERLQYYYENLASSIISQQVSGAAAQSIKTKICHKVHQFHNHDNININTNGNIIIQFPFPNEISVLSDEFLRECGLSYRKAQYIKCLSNSFLDNSLSLDLFENSDDQLIIERLTRVKGLGIWSAKMFLTFGLKKLDIFAEDDLGVARGLLKYIFYRPDLLSQSKTLVNENYKTQNKKIKKSKWGNKKRDWLPIEEIYMDQIAKQFSPYRTIFMLLMWRLSSTKIEALEK
ncbi:DNA-3-methyladenine glycosylase II, partial [Ascoidea rubescens DSM 1968]